MIVNVGDEILLHWDNKWHTISRITLHMYETRNKWCECCGCQKERLDVVLHCEDGIEDVWYHAIGHRPRFVLDRAN